MAEVLSYFAEHPTTDDILAAFLKVEAKKPEPENEEADEERAAAMLKQVRLPQWLGLQLGPRYLGGVIKDEVLN